MSRSCILASIDLVGAHPVNSTSCRHVFRSSRFAWIRSTAIFCSSCVGRLVLRGDMSRVATGKVLLRRLLQLIGPSIVSSHQARSHARLLLGTNELAVRWSCSISSVVDRLSSGHFVRFSLFVRLSARRSTGPAHDLVDCTISALASAK